MKQFCAPLTRISHGFAVPAQGPVAKDVLSELVVRNNHTVNHAVRFILSDEFLFIGKAREQLLSASQAESHRNIEFGLMGNGRPSYILSMAPYMEVLFGTEESD